MVQRPIFIPNVTGNQLVHERMIEFTWHAGMAATQKRKNVKELHESASKLDIMPLLEVSTKSNEVLGVSLSAFNLKVETAQGLFISLESAFQGSKVFQLGGPYQDLYGNNGFEIKKDNRLKKSGDLLFFKFGNIRWELEPKTAFYDWLYIHAVHRERSLSEKLISYKGFTDIEFNPKKSVNCQARSCALYVSLFRRNILERALNSREFFIDSLSRDSFFQPHSEDGSQSTLF